MYSYEKEKCAPEGDLLGIAAVALSLSPRESNLGRQVLNGRGPTDTLTRVLRSRKNRGFDVSWTAEPR